MDPGTIGGAVAVTIIVIAGIAIVIGFILGATVVWVL